MDAPAGKRMAPFLAEIVTRLRACGELDISDEVAKGLGEMSAATIDRRRSGSVSDSSSRAAQAPSQAPC